MLIDNRGHPSFFLSLLLLLAGCQGHPSYPPAFLWTRSTQLIIQHAENNGFSRQEYETDSFRLTTFEKLTSDKSDRIHVYIEGDGNSWKSRYVLSNNPTPKQPLALRLASEDTHPNVIYIARPCQYTPHALDPLCIPQYWSSHRYAPEVIQAFHDTLDQLKSKTKITQFYLVGFSGGASIAALLASERNDVICLTTIAGDLNHDALSRYHHTTPLSHSLNPIHIASKLKSLPQYHFSGGHDKIVPPWMAKEFAQAVNDPACVRLQIFPEVKHHAGWMKHAHEIYSINMKC